MEDYHDFLQNISLIYFHGKYRGLCHVLRITGNLMPDLMVPMSTIFMKNKSLKIENLKEN